MKDPLFFGEDSADLAGGDLNSQLVQLFPKQGLSDVLMVILVPATLFGLGDTFLGSEAERMVGPIIVGGGLTGILLCCVVMLLVDIRATVTTSKPS